MPTQPPYYELLQVDRKASEDVIEAAYRRLARKYRPDLNNSPEAVSLMQQLNEARRVLCDPEERARYDQSLHDNESSSSQQQDNQENTRNDIPQQLACQACGRIDETLRATVFEYVISIIVFSFKRGGGAGILCSRCRTKRAIGYTVLSVLLGPWGLPWGVFWTLEALVINLTGGRQPKEINGPLLRALGGYLWSVGMQRQAAAAFESSLHFEENTQIREALGEIRKYTQGSIRSSGLPIGIVFAGAFAILLCAALLIFTYGQAGQNPVQQSGSSYTTPEKVVSQRSSDTPTQPRFTPNANPPGWAKYTSTELGFSAFIPAKWEVEIHPKQPDNPGQGISFAPATEDTGPDATVISVLAIPMPSTGGFGSIASSELRRMAEKWINDRQLKAVQPIVETKIANVPAVHMVYESDLGTSGYSLRGYSAFVSTPRWLYFVEVAGIADFDEQLASTYKTFTEGFRSRAQ